MKITISQMKDTIDMNQDIKHLVRMVYGSDYFQHHSFPWYKTMFYRYKTIICLILRLNCPPDHACTYLNKSIAVFEYGRILICTDYGNGEGWDEIRVGLGLFRNWWYLECDDSSI